MKKAGWILTALVAAFLLPASVAPKLLGAQVAADSLTTIGWSTSHVLWTGLLGGTIASHLRAFVRGYMQGK